ncbi:MAG TPA: hypothetical protein VGB63_07900 [Pedobacter sp.]|jgi:hypothetical protein
MKNLIYFLLISCLFTWGCPAYDPPSGSLEILNYTDSPIYVLSTCSEELSANEPGLELFLNRGNVKSTDQCGITLKDTIAPNYRIDAYSWGAVYIGGTAGNPVLNCSSKKVSVFFFSEKTIRSRKWETIISDSLYDRRMILTEAELKKACFRITYD